MVRSTYHGSRNSQFRMTSQGDNITFVSCTSKMDTTVVVVVFVSIVSSYLHTTAHYAIVFTWKQKKPQHMYR